MKLHSLDELLDRDIGPVGTPKRDEFERKLADEIHAYHVGEAITYINGTMTLAH